MEHPVKNESAAPEDQSGTAQGNFDSPDNTTTDLSREALIVLAVRIEQDRRIAALRLAELYNRSPEAAITSRLVLRDLRLLGQGVGRLAFSQQRGGN